MEQRIISCIEKFGLESTLKILANNYKIIKDAYFNEPKLFLTNFNDLELIQDGTTNCYMKGEELIFRHYSNGDCCFYGDIWKFFFEIMKMEYKKIVNLVKEWLIQRYGFEDPINIKFIVNLTE